MVSVKPKILFFETLHIISTIKYKRVENFLLQTNFEKSKQVMKYRMTIKDGSPTVNTSTEYFNATGGPDGMGAWQTFHYHSPKVAIHMFLSIVY